MSRPMDQKRLRQLAVIGGGAVVLTLLVGVMAALEARQSWRPAMSGPVIAGWVDRVQSIAEIEIRSATDHFTVTRADGGWVMPSRDGHRVNPERLAELDALLGSLNHAGLRTADPAKHSRLSLARPGLAGGGLGVAARDVDGAVVADVILGDMRGGRVYVRYPGADQTYVAVPGELITAMPDLGEADRWLELDFIELGRSGIARAQIQPERGPAYVLERASPTSRNFSLREPGGWQPITAGAGNGPGASLARLRFRDVRSAERLGGERVARHTAETFEGLRITLEIIAMGDTRWAVIEADALSDDAMPAAVALNARTDGWAYLLSDFSAERLLRPLDGIADPREE
jgi:hypothetical protein